MIYITKYFDGLLNAIEFCSDLRWTGGGQKPKEFIPPVKISYLTIENSELYHSSGKIDINHHEQNLLSTGEFLSFCEKEFPKKPRLEMDPDGNEAKVIKISNGKFFIRSSLDSHTKWESPVVDTEKEAIEEWNKVMRAYHDREAADRR